MNISLRSIFKMVLTGEGQTNRRNICLGDTFYTTDPKCIGRELNTGVLRCKCQWPSAISMEWPDICMSEIICGCNLQRFPNTCAGNINKKRERNSYSYCNGTDMCVRDCVFLLQVASWMKNQCNKHCLWQRRSVCLGGLNIWKAIEQRLKSSFLLRKRVGRTAGVRRYGCWYVITLLARKP
jgi:hypothetical protein